MANKYISFVNEFANIPHYNVCRIFVLGHPLLLYTAVVKRIAEILKLLSNLRSCCLLYYIVLYQAKPGRPSGS